MSRPFFDTNVLLYGYSLGDPKAAHAQKLLAMGGVISVQCLNEFASVARRKLGMSWERVEAALLVIARLCDPVLPLDVDLHRLGLSVARERRLSIYDGMIVAAALKGGCDTLYSEDMQHGLVIDGALRIENPFLSL